MLNPDFKAQWLAALRSGEYSQAKGRLYDGTGYCCLGVACRVLGATFVHEGNNVNGAIWLPKFNGTDAPSNAQFLLPTGLANDLGMTGPMQTTLAKMNDKQDQNFYQIADYIQSNY